MKIRFTLRLPPDLHKQLTELAAHQGISMNDLIIIILRTYFERGRETTESST